MAQNLEASRTARLLADQELVVAGLRNELVRAELELARRRRSYQDAVNRTENWK